MKGLLIVTSRFTHTSFNPCCSSLHSAIEKTENSMPNSNFEKQCTTKGYGMANFDDPVLKTHSDRHRQLVCDDSCRPETTEPKMWRLESTALAKNMLRMGELENLAPGSSILRLGEQLRPGNSSAFPSGPSGTAPVSSYGKL